ncbi:CLUMA_CG018238, isoform A [Clunio marinus]|uniref:CLUMA_CG018238, isoform A n=1 Tax=Clunio marinus TaxID=568069 RepID=A0A1J1IYX5_9DIPT|nr:CLUMA_CG018238, isoform A [Clunio marinus]
MNFKFLILVFAALFACEICSLPKKTGPCRGVFRRWYYNAQAKECQAFIYAGCYGNSNNFLSEEECLSTCVLKMNLKFLILVFAALFACGYCTLPSEMGPCKAALLRWYFDVETKTCQTFSWGGCGGNSNKFLSEEECLKICTLPSETGDCRAVILRWYYNAQAKECQGFVWGGCGGNANKFLNEVECLRTCDALVFKSSKIAKMNFKLIVLVLVLAVPFASACSCMGGFVPRYCAMPSAIGRCKSAYSRWYFDAQTKHCRPFNYSGCGGNPNNFPTEEDCVKTCGFCSLSYEVGKCQATFTRWYYNAKDKKCHTFTYGGCGGNSNNFQNEADCMKICAPKKFKMNFKFLVLVFAALFVRVKLEKKGRVVPKFCKLASEMGPCEAAFTRWYFDVKTKKCQTFTWGGCGGNPNNFQSEVECLTTCSGLGFCALPSDGGPCKAFYSRWYYNAQDNECQTFTWGGCMGNLNNFQSETHCNKACGEF